MLLDAPLRYADSQCLADSSDPSDRTHTLQHSATCAVIPDASIAKSACCTTETPIRSARLVPGTQRTDPMHRINDLALATISSR
jgi:hypothetical protein